VPAVSFECISEGVTIPQVVAATATAFADQLALAPGPAPTAGTAAATPYLRGQWQTLPLASYSYRTRLSASATPEPRNYAFGTFGLRAFDWENSLRARPAAWLTAAVTEQASPNGDVLQERDPLGIASAAKFGYGQSATGQPARTLPYLQAHNAEAAAVLFESFENWYTSNGTTSGEDELVLPADVQRVSEQTQPGYAHTGQQAARLLNRQLALKALPLTPTLSAQGLLVKVWVRLPDYDATQFSAFVDVTRVSTGAVTSTGLTTGVRTGEWQLFEARVALSASAASVGELVRPSLRFSAGGASAVYVDDVRVQPGESQMTAYVYDPVSLRLVASFDDQHFALRYQYNQEGKLIRKQAETARGLKTLQETHYHSPNTDQVNN
jgi:YD repeat-containing protein